MGAPHEQRWGASTACEAGNRVFVSGLTAEGPNAATQLHAAIGDLRRLLSSLDTSLADVVRTWIFHTAPEDRERLGAVHGEWFGAARPALSVTQAHFLPSGPNGAGVVLEAEAVRGASDQEAGG